MADKPRSRSRSKRSTTNLSDLRLAPLSAKFAEDTAAPAVKTPAAETPDASFTRQHPSYIQGKSAPTTPGILSRSSSRKHLGGGLSRKNSLYEDHDDEGVEFAYAGARDTRRASVDSTLPKAKSEATLLKTHSPTRKYKYPVRRPRTGASTPAAVDENWLSHAGATASAIVQEGKGQSWLASRDVRPAESEEDEDDDQYEEMAALSASTAQLHFAPFEGGSPVSTRVSRWGSRYGSRTTSRRTSRRASPSAGMRTPRQGDAGLGYFDAHHIEEATKAGSVEGEEDSSTSDIEGLGEANSFGLGPLVDRLMNFNPFKADDGVDSTDDEVEKGRENETEDEALRRRSVEMQRRRDAKAKLAAQPPPAPLGAGDNGEGEVGGWSDAAWLLSVATKAMF